MYDATVAAWDAKYTYAPAAQRQPTRPPDRLAVPSESLVSLGACGDGGGRRRSSGLSYPADAKFFRDLAEEAGRAALAAGIAYPSDVIAGLQLGRAVGAKVVAMAQNDGSQAVWTGSVPTGAGFWVGATPLEPLAGTGGRGPWLPEPAPARPAAGV